MIIFLGNITAQMFTTTYLVPDRENPQGKEVYSIVCKKFMKCRDDKSCINDCN